MTDETPAAAPVSVEGMNVLITGASSGIGEALALALVARGATVGIVARREDKLSDVLTACQKVAPDSKMWVADLADLDRANEVALEAWDAFGHLDVLVNNAAIPSRRHAATLSYEEVELVNRVNFLAPVRMTTAVLPKMLERGSGTIVNVSSMGGRIPISKEAAYCAAKFGLCGWSEVLAIDLTGSGVRVRLVLPGPIDTGIWDIPGQEEADYDGTLYPPSMVAQGMIEAIEGDRFEHFLPETPDMDWEAIAKSKANDTDGFIHLMALLAAG